MVRSAIAVLDGNRWLSARIFGLAQRARPDLIQVGRYLAEDVIRERAQAVVAELLDDDTQVVIGHSLGSVVAWEACHERTTALPMLITMHPLGLDTVSLPSASPPASGLAARSKRWVNIAHRDDFIAVETLLAPLFPSRTTAASKNTLHPQ